MMQKFSERVCDVFSCFYQFFLLRRQTVGKMKFERFTIHCINAVIVDMTSMELNL
jgi:hypothetical protein